MSRIREKIVVVLTAILIAVTINQSWSKEKIPAENPIPAVSEVTSPELSVEEHLFLVQTKLVIGGIRYFENKQKELGQEFNPSEVIQTVITTFKEQGLEQKDLKNIDLLSPEIRQRLLRKKILVAEFLDLEDSKKYLVNRLENFKPQTESEEKLNSQFLSFLEKKKLKPSTAESFKEDLGWHYRLVEIESASSPSEKERIEEAVLKSAGESFLKLLIVISVISLIFISGFVFFVAFAIMFFRGKLPSRLEINQQVSPYLLEIFCLYLSGMLLGSLLLGKFLTAFKKSNPMQLNAIFITSLILFIAWPVFFGIKFKDVRSSLGFQFISFKKFLSDVFFAPIVYVSAWIFLITVFLIYSIILTSLGVDMSGGTHPIVPIIMATKKESILIYIFVLAVIVAPFIEETMFRGALYGWMRSKFSISLSVFASSLIFAAVHPQGLLGIVPLTAIGIVLAVIREWRGNLICPMIVHGMVNGGTLTLIFLFFK